MNEVTTFDCGELLGCNTMALWVLTIWSITAFIHLTHRIEKQSRRWTMRIGKYSKRCMAPTALSVLGVLVLVFMASNAFAWNSAAYTDSVDADVYKAYHALDWRFIADDNGVVTDAKTSLEWFAGPDRDTTWDEAQSWVESLSVDSGGWRMPTREELRNLHSKGAGTRNMSRYLKTTGWFVWTSETASSPTRSYAWGFSFNIGDEYRPPCTYSGPARGFAVRSARCGNPRKRSLPVAAC
jgi:hypothetical protein